MVKRRLKRLKNKKGAAMLLALFTVIILAAVGTAFFAITVTENNTTTSRIDSELALEMANAGLEYLSLVASVQTSNSLSGGSFWSWNTTQAVSQPNVGNSNMFAALPDGNYQLVFDVKHPGTPRDVNQLLLAEKGPDGKLAGCIVILPGSHDKLPDIVATSIGFVLESDDPDGSFLSDTGKVNFYAARSVQAVLKEVTYYNYAYIYQNFTDLDLPFNVPDSYLEYMKNMVGLTPGTVINGGVRADGVDASTANADTINDRIARLLLWDENGYPTTATDPSQMARVNGTVSLVSSDSYNGSGPEVVDNMIGNYKLTENMKKAFQGYTTTLQADQTGVPGATPEFMSGIRSLTNFSATSSSSNPNITKTAGSGGGAQYVSINNNTIRKDQASDIGEDLNGDEKADYSKNLCKINFTTTSDNKTQVTVNIYNRYAGLTSQEGTAGAAGNISDITSTPACLLKTETFTLDKGAVFYVDGGNVLVDGQVGSDVTIVAADSRTPKDPNYLRANKDKISCGIDELLGDGSTDEEKFFRHMEKSDPQGSPASEGNLYITGDIKNKDDALAPVGLISENYTYLHQNPSTTSSTLNVRAQLNSIRQSVQFDFFNSLKEKNFFESGGGRKGYNGTFNFVGQMMGKQADVEGDIDGRGYSDINISYDNMLKYASAPHFFTVNYTDVPSGVTKYAITGYFDMGSLSIK